MSSSKTTEPLLESEELSNELSESDSLPTNILPKHHILPKYQYHILRIAQVMMLAEYVCVGVFFTAGYDILESPALPLQFLFAASAAIVEYIVYRKMGEPFGDAIQETICMIPIQCFRIPKWVYLLLTLTPNYIHIISSAVAAGLSFHIWSHPPNGKPEELHEDHCRNWIHTPVIGYMVAHAGIPHILTTLLVASMVSHLLLGSAFQLVDGSGMYVGEWCDCANLQFLKKAMHRNEGQSEEEEVKPTRLILTCSIKLLLLWAKTSFTAVMWDYMDAPMKRSMIFAVLLAWYGMLQLLPIFARQLWSVIQYQCKICRCLNFSSALLVFVVPSLILVCGLAQQALHFGGIWVCAATHDFSLLQGGCTLRTTNVTKSCAFVSENRS